MIILQQADTFSRDLLQFTLVHGKILNGNLNNQCYKYAIIPKTPNEYMTAIFNHTNLETTVKYNSKLMT